MLRWIHRWLCVLPLLGLISCAPPNAPVSRLRSTPGDQYLCDVELRTEPLLKDRRDVYRVVSTTRYIAKDGVDPVQILSTNSRALRGEDPGAVIAQTPGSAGPVGRAEGSDVRGNGPSGAESFPVSHDLYRSALEHGEKKQAAMPLRLSTADGKSLDLLLIRQGADSVWIWSNASPNVSDKSSGKPAFGSAAEVRLPAQDVGSIKNVAITITGEGPAKSADVVKLSVDFVWTKMGDAPTRLIVVIRPSPAQE